MAGTARGAAAIKLREVVSGSLAKPEEPNPAFEKVVPHPPGAPAVHAGGRTE